MASASTLASLVSEGEDELYSVTLEKKSSLYGLAYRVLADNCLVVTGVVCGSAAQSWNQTCKKGDVICVGDKILAVNDVTLQSGAKALVDELVQSTPVVYLTLWRTGPRWHVLDMGSGRGIGSSLGSRLHHNIRDSDSNNHLQRLGPSELLKLFAAFALPNVVLLALFSDIGIGLTVFNFFAGPANYNFIGSAIIGLACALGTFLYIFDWITWRGACLKATSALAVMYMTVLGGVMKCRFYPQAPMVLCLLHVPVLLGILRMRHLRRVKRSHFYIGSAASALVVVVAVLVVWLLWQFLDSVAGLHNYSDATKADLAERSSKLYEFTTIEIGGRTRSLDNDWDCIKKMNYDFKLVNGTKVEDRLLPKLTAKEKAIRTKECSQVKTSWFLVWITPFASLVCNAIIGAFCFINGVWLSLDDTSKLEKALKHFMLMLAVLVLSMWVSASISGASMRLTGTLMAFCGTGIILLFIWLYLEIGKKAIASTLIDSKILRSLVVLATSDWVRAMVVMGFNVMIPFSLLVNMLNQKVRKIRGIANSNSLFTEGVDKVMEHLATWNWASILLKVNWLVIAFWTLQVGVAKITVVFLSWLNEALQEVEFELVTVIFFVIGYIMFLLPPVPGIPVYICSGIIITARARSREDIGFWGGTVIAVGVSFVLKLAAVCGQYMIGFFMGKSVKIQQLVAVDKVFTRSIEKILKTRGLNLPKVSVLVGGPDWPTSVLCGILRLSLFQCVLGTTPVILVSSPCVLAGAFISGPEEGAAAAADADADAAETSGDGSSSMWATMASSMLAASAACQLASGVIAMYYIQEVVYKHSDELAKPRPEHARIAELTQREAAFVEMYRIVTAWARLSRSLRCFVLLATCTMLASFFIFLFMDEACFRSFETNDSIGAKEEHNGLDGNVLNIVKMPGWAAHALFFSACGLHCVFLQLMARRTAARLREEQDISDTSESAAALADAPGTSM